MLNESRLISHRIRAPSRTVALGREPPREGSHPLTAYEQGRAASEHHKPMSENPHPRGSREHHFWRLGWEKGKIEKHPDVEHLSDQNPVSTDKPDQLAVRDLAADLLSEHTPPRPEPLGLVPDRTHSIVLNNVEDTFTVKRNDHAHLTLWGLVVALFRKLLDR
jgi:hypothetical protein